MNKPFVLSPSSVSGRLRRERARMVQILVPAVCLLFWLPSIDCGRPGGPGKPFSPKTRPKEKAPAGALGKDAGQPPAKTVPAPVPRTAGQEPGHPELASFSGLEDRPEGVDDPALLIPVAEKLLAALGKQKDRKINFMKTMNGLVKRIDWTRGHDLPTEGTIEVFQTDHMDAFGAFLRIVTPDFERCQPGAAGSMRVLGLFIRKFERGKYRLVLSDFSKDGFLAGHDVAVTFERVTNRVKSVWVTWKTTSEPSESGKDGHRYRICPEDFNASRQNMVKKDGFLMVFQDGLLAATRSFQLNEQVYGGGSGEVTSAAFKWILAGKRFFLIMLVHKSNHRPRDPSDKQPGMTGTCSLDVASFEWSGASLQFVGFEELEKPGVRDEYIDAIPESRSHVDLKNCWEITDVFDTYTTFE